MERGIVLVVVGMVGADEVDEFVGVGGVGRVRR